MLKLLLKVRGFFDTAFSQQISHHGFGDRTNFISGLRVMVGKKLLRDACRGDHGNGAAVLTHFRLWDFNSLLCRAKLFKC